jgi:hypothetical protein
VKGVFGLAQRRGIVTSNPCDGLTSAERPKQMNTEKIERLDSANTSELIAAGSTERWKAGLGLAGLGGFASERFVSFSGATSTWPGTRSAFGAHCSRMAARRR